VLSFSTGGIATPKKALVTKFLVTIT